MVSRVVMGRMPTFSAGRNSARHARTAGVTLLEMLVVVGLIALMVGITFPSVMMGLDSLRLRSAAGEVSSLFNSALTRADRLQDAVELNVSPQRRSIASRAIRTNVTHQIDLPQGIHIAHVYPEDLRWAVDDSGALVDRHFIVYPNGSVPRIVIDLANDRGAHRIVMLDPITGVARERTTTDPESQDTNQPSTTGVNGDQ
jgi:type II secretory pathway pseudopilin PulG